MRHYYFFLLSLIANFTPLPAQDLEAFEYTEAWLEKIAELAPKEPAAPPGEGRKVLIFSLFTGYEHWAIPHTEAVVKRIAEQAGIAECTVSTDIEEFEAARISSYDAIVLNNTCPEREKRDLFYDRLGAEGDLPEAERQAKAAQLEDNLIAFVKNGGGLLLLHGGTTIQNNSQEFSEMTGGSFDFHPPQQSIEVKLAEPEHPLVRAFNGQGFQYIDEPYFFKNAYDSYNFRPLLYMEASSLKGLDREMENDIRYIAWIKKHGQGHVFVSAPSHNAQSFENPQLLRFYMDGLQYALGDLKCEDAPLKE